MAYTSHLLVAFAAVLSVVVAGRVDPFENLAATHHLRSGAALPATPPPLPATPPLGGSGGGGSFGGVTLPAADSAGGGDASFPVVSDPVESSLSPESATVWAAGASTGNGRRVPVSPASWLAAHNDNYRLVHRSPPLAYDTFIAAKAQSWCDKLAARPTPGDASMLTWTRPDRPSPGVETATYLQDVSGENLGQNLAFVRSAPDDKAKDHPDVAMATTAQWYKEVAQYDFASPKWNPLAFQFTQLVWKSTTLVGCGATRIHGDRVITCCDYSVAGNTVGPGADAM